MKVTLTITNDDDAKQFFMDFYQICNIL